MRRFLGSNRQTTSVTDGRLHPAQIVDRKGQPIAISDPLYRFSINLAIGRAQHFVARDNRAQCRMQALDIQTTAQAQGAAHAIGVAALQAVDEPQPPL
ncbi:hypothetical protein LMG19145_03987 [Xanthomonas arboricola pv. fragariae]|nr:hypothetical protein LMG19145_03987 [Xanthomonas arboricola pv. fragariae]